MATLPLREHVARVRAGIAKVVSIDAEPLVDAYYNPVPTSYARAHNVLFAGRYFDELPGNDPEKFTVGDLAAASLLDVRFGPHTILELLERDECSSLLAQIPADKVLWEASEQDLCPFSAAGQLWQRLLLIPGVGQTRASKLLARKRPHLMPILDSVIVDRLGIAGGDGWLLLRDALTPDIRSRIDVLASAATRRGAMRPSTLRLLDVATWMRHSQSRQARAVRQALAT